MKSTVELLHEQLDRHPDDHTIRLVLADALEEEGSVLAVGYRAIAAQRRRPLTSIYMSDLYNYGRAGNRRDYETDPSEIPSDWWVNIEGGRARNMDRWVDHGIRRASEDALAFAFTKLPPDRQRELLEGKL